MLQRKASLLCVLMLTALTASSAQVLGQSTTIVRRDTLSGTWGATNGSVRFAGTWTAIPDTARGTVIGTWTLADPQGTTLAFGGWAAAKSGTRWTGGWRANVTGRADEYSGTWASSIALEANARFIELFETAAQTIVSGTWKSGGRSGAWSIRVAR